MTAPIETMLAIVRHVVNVPVVTRVPAKRPETFVRVEQVSTRRQALTLDQTLFIIQVYAPKRVQAYDLMVTIREALHVADRQALVCAWEESSGIAEFPDPDLDTTYRWQLTGSLLTFA